MSAPSVISVVDDDASVRASMNNLFSSLGYVVHTFESAEQYLRSPHLSDTSCVITDVQMPGMDGVELLAKAGAIGFFAKPFAMPNLIACLDAALASQAGNVGA